MAIFGAKISLFFDKTESRMGGSKSLDKDVSCKNAPEEYLISWKVIKMHFDHVQGRSESIIYRKMRFLG